jgi:hypothetical protein
MTASIRGHQGRIKVYRQGKDTLVVNLTRVDINQDSSFTRSNYVGNALPEGDQSIEGWSGSMDAEVKDDAIDQFIDALVNQNLAGIGVEDITVLSEEYYPDGRVASYVYFDCQFRMSKSIAGLTEKQTKRLDFQASGRQRL